MIISELESKEIFIEIVNSLEDAGYDPYEQLLNYIKSGDDRYITRKNDARVKIKLLEISYIKKLINKK